MVGSDLAVGSLLVDGRTAWPETSDLTITAWAVEIRLYRRSPSASLLHAVSTKSVRFFWVDNPGIAIVRFTFTDEDASDEPEWFEIIYTPRTEMIGRGRLPGGSGDQVQVRIAVIDASTGVVAAVRIVTWSAENSDFVRERLSGVLAIEDSLPSADRSFVERVRQHMRFSARAADGFADSRSWAAR